MIVPLFLCHFHAFLCQFYFLSFEQAQPKDLTSTLMENNLKLMTSPMTSQSNQQSGMMMGSQGANFMPRPAPGMSFHQATPIQGSYAVTQSAPSWQQQPAANGVGMSSFNGASNPGRFPSYNSGMMGFQTHATALQTQARAKHTGGSSLDNLLTMSCQSKRTLNQMQNVPSMPQTMSAMPPMSSNTFPSQRMATPAMASGGILAPQRAPMHSQALQSNQPPTQALGKQDLLDFLGWCSSNIAIALFAKTIRRQRASLVHEPRRVQFSF